MSAVPHPENPLQPFVPDFDERICTHLVARGRLKEADLARQLQHMDAGQAKEAAKKAGEEMKAAQRELEGWNLK